MRLPVLVVNFKTYPSATGKNAVELAKIHQKMAEKTGISIALAVQAVDLRFVTENVDLPVFAQHFDVAEQGAFTGYVSPYSLKDAGAYGSLLNHAERKLPVDVLQSSIDLARSQGLFTIVCAESVFASKAVSELSPDLVAFEPPELIGGDVSVSNAQPQLIQDAVAMMGKGKVLVGAGIKTAEDVKLALKFGAAGVLVSSVVTRAHDPEKALEELLKGFL
ncbi:triose-phosphate isomerase [Candidatus Peregrinibacteria bacterium]|nr:triose-phosphate isomerase [Candidatus Peregrinibacteria bacterium]